MTTAENPTITFIICTYNRANYLDRALGSLRDQKLDTDQTYEILVVDNNSSDRTAEVFNEHQSANSKDRNPIRYVKETNQGLTYARNRGIRESQAPYVVFLDDDIRASEKLITAWLQFFNDNPDAIAAGGRIHVRFDAERPEWMSHFLLPLVGRHDLGKTIKKYPSHKFPFGGNMGFKKSIFEEVGYFDTELGKKGDKLYAKGEEKELFDRVRAQTNQIYYIPDAFLYHHVDGSRLTRDYVHNQARSLGQGMWLRLQEVSTRQFMESWMREIGKTAASVLLFIYYLLTFHPAKASMVLKFRWWIWRGYWGFAK